MPSFSVAGDSGGGDLPASPLMQAPGVTPLGRPMAFDLAVPWWRSWWSQRPSLANLSTRLERLLRREFEPLIADLIGAAMATLEERSRIAGRQARLCTLDIVEGIHRRSKELVAGLHDGADGLGPSSVAQLEQEHAAAQARAAWLADQRNRLSALVLRCDSMLRDRGAA